jgi:hypothetical protein
MKRKLILPLITIAVLALAGCVANPAAQQEASKGSMPMPMAMTAEGMMAMCDMHMSQMSPEMMQKHMEMMHWHHQIMEQRMKPRQPG